MVSPLTTSSRIGAPAFMFASDRVLVTLTVGADSVRLLIVSTCGKPAVSVSSIVTVLVTALVMKSAESLIVGALVSDHLLSASQKSVPAKTQLFVAAWAFITTSPI